ncbi:endonuclease/exonuclease/phosphatase family protein [Streptomyces sp. NPDC089799]|uniref:endonuclease/exonuclease/phosphatase family protein n=1 Tax=Streptomyces sp. NPDC089799 TaxID=3155066 RepID=UPI00342EF1C6
MHPVRRSLIAMVTAMGLLGVCVTAYASTARPAAVLADDVTAMPYAVEDFTHDLQAATGPLRVVTWNMCGDAGGARGEAGYCPRRNFPAEKVKALTDLVARHKANVIMLQEACGYTQGQSDPAPNPQLSHMRLLDEALPDDWQLVHAPGTREDGTKNCRAGTEPGLTGPFVGGEIGVLLAVKGGFTQPQIIETLPRGLRAEDFTSLPTGYPQLPAEESGTVLTDAIEKLDRRKSPVLCVRPNAWAEKLCTSHLSAGQKEKKFPEIIRTMQARLIRDELSTDFRNGIVFGGDLNARGDSPTLEGISGGLDRCATDPALHTHQTWRGATPSAYTLDHVFTGRDAGHRFTDCLVDQSLMDMTQQTPGTQPTTGVSDHAPVIAYLGAPGRSL